MRHNVTLHVNWHFFFINVYLKVQCKLLLSSFTERSHHNAQLQETWKLKVLGRNHKSVMSADIHTTQRNRRRTVVTALRLCIC